MLKLQHNDGSRGTPLTNFETLGLFINLGTLKQSCKTCIVSYNNSLCEDL